jgi:hypothetical protein
MKLLTILFILIFGLSVFGQAVSNITILNSLGTATPSTKFSDSGSGAFVAYGQPNYDFIGPEFTLANTTVITEIGAFLNFCTDVPQCGTSLPSTVQIRRSVNGVPDSTSVLATFLLSQDNDPRIYSFESAQPNLILEAGSYFALIAPQAGRTVDILGNAESGGYKPNTVNLGFLRADRSVVSPQPAAFRILGAVLASTPTPTVTPTPTPTPTVTPTPYPTDCTYSFNPTSQDFTAAGGNTAITVITQQGCSISAESNDQFISIGFLNGQVTISVGANTGAARTAVVMIAGQTFTVNQAGAGKSRKRVRFF